MNRRKEALDILVRVMKDGGYASLIMRDKKEIGVNDMPFITNVVYGVLRNYSYLEYQWREYAKKTKLKSALVIDMAVYELFFMNEKAYAIVNECVSLVHKNEKAFVNAILRKVIENGKCDSEDLCIQYSHPNWIYQMWKAHYGQENALWMLQADQEVPSVYGRINPLRLTKQELQKDTQIHFIDDISFTADFPIQSSSYFQQGKVVIQNPSSIIPVQYLDVKENMRVLDACSAPGTKTQLISAYMNNTGKVIACDMYAHRCQLITALMQRCGNTNVQTKVQDATEESFEIESFDRILCDVPCSGLGDLRHKPEIRWHLKPENIDAIIEIQKKILEVNQAYLKVGGILVYSTCTLNKKENHGQIQKFLDKFPNFQLIEQRTIFPFEKNHDGFYVAKLLKIA